MMASKPIETTTTIKELQSEPVPNSPRKISKKLTFAVLNKSPLKPTRTGSKMFSLNLSDESPESSMRAVCFQEELFSHFDVNKSYAIESFKLKKSYGQSNFTELLIDHDTKITGGSDVTQLKIEEKVFNIAQILRGEAKNQRFLKLKGKVMRIYEAYQVGLYPNNKLRRSISLADNTGHIELVLWRERAENISFVEGDVLGLENVVVSTFNNQTTLTTTFESVISKVEDQITVAVRNVKRRLDQSSSVVSLTSYVLAVKEFQHTYSCVNCRKGISSDALKGSTTLTCPTCSTMFLKERATLNNNCMILLDDKRWFKANSSVIQHLFNWSTPQEKLTEEDVIFALNTKFSMRLDLSRKLIEFASPISEEDDNIISAMLNEDGHDNDVLPLDGDVSIEEGENKKAKAD